MAVEDFDDEAADHARSDRAGSSRISNSGTRLDDVELVAAMRRNETGAFREFFARFSPLIRAVARSRRSSAIDLTEQVTEFLDDAAMGLAGVTRPVPRALAAYLVASFRNHTRDAERNRRCRERIDDECAEEAGGVSERVVRSASSEDSVRRTQGPLVQKPTLTPAIERLALELESGLTGDDRQLLAWLGARVPQREIAVWLGATHGAVRVRVTRLRTRLRDTAFRHFHRIDGADRQELIRFFRRIDVAIPGTLEDDRRGAGARVEHRTRKEDHDP
jgi:RNA polymerase sigma factor (sigma-70 family)